MTDHVSRKLSGSLFQDIGQSNGVKIVDTFCGIFAFADLQGDRSLCVLTVEIEMSKHLPAVSGA